MRKRPHRSFASMNSCTICEKRRPRRFCPGVRGEICSLCCGTEREVTIDCPFDCEYLEDARLHERPPEIDPETVPNKDVRVSESFLREHEGLIAVCARGLFDAAATASGAIDFDVREALDALIRTYRTLDSGLIYQTTPTNPIAATIQRTFREIFDGYRKQLHERVGMETIRDADVLGVLVFLQHLEIGHNNGRRRGRAFLDFLRTSTPPPPAATQQGGDSPLVIG
ncbi:MAG: hypothetical protein ABFD60_12540 [Bryobacteraceae bacterium]